MRKANNSGLRNSARRRKTGSGSPVISGAGAWGTNSCSTGKRAWQSRRDAKDAANLLARQGKPGMNAFRCDECKLFHIGHLPHAVRMGEVSRTDYYGTAA